MLTGTGGTIATGGSGQLADSWTINNQGGGYAATLSKVPRLASGINGEWQQIVATSGSLIQFLQQNIGPIGSKINVGDQIQAMVEFETDADCADLYQFYLSLENQVGAAAGRSVVYPSADGVLTGQDIWPRRGWLRTPVVTIPTGATRLDFFLRFKVPASAATSGMTVRVGRILVTKAGV